MQANVSYFQKRTQLPRWSEGQFVELLQSTPRTKLRKPLSLVNPFPAAGGTTGIVTLFVMLAQIPVLNRRYWYCFPAVDLAIRCKEWIS